MRSHPILALLCSGALVGQTPATVADRLLHDNLAGAQAMANEVADPAVRARLQAALLPRDARPQALLAVARAFPEAAATDATLLAATAAVLLAQDRADALPELAAFCAEEGGEFGRPAPTAELLTALGEVVRELGTLTAQREAAGGDATVLAEVRRLLRLAGVTYRNLEPVRVLPGSVWAVPRPLAEDLLMTARRLGPATMQLDPFVLERQPEYTALLPMAGTPASVPPLPVGTWLLEIASVREPWRAVQAVELSDVWAIGLADEGVAAYAYGRIEGDYPDDALVRLFAGGREVARATNPEPYVGVLAAPIAERTEPERLVVSSDGQPCALDWLRGNTGQRNSAMPREPYVAHLMVDRPVHRPGEQVLGRVVLRNVERRGERLAATFATTLAADCAIAVRVFAGTPNEVVLTGRTDDHGVFPFAATVPMAASGSIAIQVEARDDAAKDWTSVMVRRPTSAAWYRRPALTAVVEGPSVVERAPADGIVSVALRANWASGGPAASMPVAARVWSSRGSEERELRTDADGIARLPIDLRTLAAGEITVRFTLDGIDGDRRSLAHPFWFGPERAAGEATARGGLAIDCDDELIVGDTASVTLTAPPDTYVLAVAGRGATARPSLLVGGEHGVPTWGVEVLPSDWPTLDLAVTDGKTVVHRRVMVRLRPRVAPRIELTPVARPGEHVTCRIATEAGAVVTIAVADERLFAIADDDTMEPTRALQPSAPEANWSPALSRTPCEASIALARLLRDGKVAPPGADQRERRGYPGGGAAAGGPAADVRSDFRASVVFATRTADAQGIAEFAFDLPSDLTTWRATVVGIAPDGEGFLERRSIATRLPLSVEPVLPRVLRSGDAVALPIAIDRDAAVGGDAGVAFAVVAEGALAVGAGAEGVRDVAPGSVAVAQVPVRAVAPGKGALALDVHCGDRRDAQRRTLTVDADELVQRHWLAAGGEGSVAIDLPAADAGSAMEPIEVTVLAGSAAAWSELGARLDEYPYGCVEQTMSRLLPFAAEGRAAKRRGEALPERSRDAIQRIGHGLARLRELQAEPGEAFAWWPGEPVDRAMTGLVLHGLASLRDSGIDLASHGLRIDATAGDFGRATSALQANAGAVRDGAAIADAETVAGLLRWDGTVASVRAAAEAIADAPQPLPPGLLARLGLAFATAGDATRAGRCAQRAAAAVAEAGAPMREGFPGEAFMAVRAQRLELAATLDRAADLAVPMQELLRDLLAGPCHTYADGAAMTALALVLPKPRGDAVRATVTVGGERREVAIDAEHRFAARLSLPRGARCEVALPGQFVFARVGVVRRERASDHASWAAPLRVERELQRRSADGMFVAVDGPVRAGESLRVRVQVTSPRRVSYVVVDCPLPAGVELLGGSLRDERTDRGVHRTVARIDAGRPVQLEFACVATLCGRVAWPPTTAAAMYDDATAGGSAGGWLAVEPAKVAAAAAVTPCFSAPRAPADDRQQESPAERLAAMVRDGWSGGLLLDGARQVHGVVASGFGAEDAAAAVQRVDQALAQLEALVATDAEGVLRSTDVSLVDVSRRIGGATEAWRERSAARLWAVRSAAVDRLLDLCARGGDAAANRDRLELLIDEVGGLDAEAAQHLAARLLPLVARDVPARTEAVLGELEPPVADARLRAQLRAMLRGDDAELAFYLLPDDDLLALPPVVLARWLDPALGAVERAVRLLLRTAPGRTELQRSLATLPSEAWTEDVVALLPDELFAAAPLRVYDQLAENDEARAVRLLAASSWPTADLQRELAKPTGVVGDGLVAAALERRGVTTLALDPATLDTAGRIWALALDPQAGQQLAAAAAAAPECARGDLQPFVSRRLALRADADGLVTAVAWIDGEDWVTALARFDRDTVLRVIAAIDAPLDFPPTDDPEVAKAMFEHALAHGGLSSVVEALAATACGAEVARAGLRRIEPEPTGFLRRSIADALDLDRDSLLPATEVTPRRTLRLLLERGFAGACPPELQPLRDRMLVLRGIAR